MQEAGFPDLLIYNKRIILSGWTLSDQKSRRLSTVLDHSRPHSELGHVLAFITVVLSCGDILYIQLERVGPLVLQ